MNSGGENVWTLNLWRQREKANQQQGTTIDYQGPEWTPDGKYMICFPTGR